MAAWRDGRLEFPAKEDPLSKRTLGRMTAEPTRSKALSTRRSWAGSKVGLILPSVNTLVEPTFYRIAPEGISFFSTRLLIKGTRAEDVAEMDREKNRAIRELASAKVDCIADCCTMAGVLHGLEPERAAIEQISGTTGIPATSTLLSIIEALEVLKIRALVITSPYPKEFDILEKAFFERNGFNVVNTRGLGIADGYEFAQVTPEKIYDFCTSAWDNKADALLMSCMNFNSMPVIEPLEAELKVPVISSPSATFWKILKMSKVTQPIVGYGRLLSQYL